MASTVTLKHPTLPNVFKDVASSDAKDWKDQGWEVATKNELDDPSVVVPDEPIQPSA